MTTEDRYAFILEKLLTEGHVETSTLTQTLEVSEMTVRRDLMRLEGDGALRRIRGGAVRANGGAYEPPFAVRTRLRSAQKEAIARAVVNHIVDGETIVLDGGTTGLAIAEHLVGKLTTVCPLSLRAAAILIESQTVRVLAPGGFVRAGEHTFIGPDAVDTIRRHSFDTFVMTASGISRLAGYTEWNEEDALVKRAALASASRCVVACDSSKFGQAAFARVAELTAADLIITDERGDSAIRSEIEDSGAKVEIARMSDDARAPVTA